MVNFQGGLGNDRLAVANFTIYWAIKDYQVFYSEGIFGSDQGSSRRVIVQDA